MQFRDSRNGNARIMPIGVLSLAAALIVATALIPTPAYGITDVWDSWRFFFGEWVAEDSSRPEQGSGEFSFTLDLNDNILVRKNHTEYPATKDKAAIIHDDLMIIYHDMSGSFRAIYFDNEGHTINYTAEFCGKGDTLTFLSDIIPKMPRFRLLYIKTGPNEVSISFDIAQPEKPDEFSTYLRGMARRK